MTQAVDLLILTAASQQVGHGHVMRCRGLAEEARKRGLATGFGVRDKYTRNLLQALGEEVVADGFLFAPYIIRDFNNGSAVAEVQTPVARGAVVLLMDDLGPARTAASLVVDAFMTPYRRARYEHGADTRYLYGLKYAPLHKNFRENHGAARPGARRPARLLLSFGGGDPLAITWQLAEALDQEGFRGPTKVILNSKCRGFQQVMGIVRRWQDSEVLPHVANMATMMAGCDLVATKLGVTMLEAFCVGIGCILVEPTLAHVAIHQEQVRAYDSWPAIDFGLATGLDFRRAAREIMAILQDSHRLAGLGQQGALLVDGLGVKQIIDEMVGPG